MSNQVPPGPGQPPAGAEPPYGPYSSQVPDMPPPPGAYPPGGPPVAPPPGSYPSHEPYGQQPQAGQPSYGPSPQPGAYGAPPSAATGAPYGAYGPYPPPPTSGSGGKIIAIVAAAVVVVGLVIGGVALLAKGDDSPDNDAATTSTSTKKSPKPPTTKSTRTPKSPEPEPDPEPKPSDAELDLAEAAYTGAAGYDPFECTRNYYSYSLFDDTDFALYCSDDDYDSYEVYKWPDVETALESIRSYGAYRGRTGYYTEGTWSGGASFIRDDYSYNEIRCYADVPLCIEVSANNAQQAEDKFSHIVFADAAGIETLKGLISGGGV